MSYFTNEEYRAAVEYGIKKGWIKPPPPPPPDIPRDVQLRIAREARAPRKMLTPDEQLEAQRRHTRDYRERLREAEALGCNE